VTAVALRVRQPSAKSKFVTLPSEASLQSGSPDQSQKPGAALATRVCGSCTMCCKVYDVPEVDSLAGQWCRNCAPGRGCVAWETRPDQCRKFECLWRTQEWLGPEWKPETAKMIFTIDPTGRFLQFQVDPGAPNAWKRQPYYGNIKSWAASGVASGKFVLVFVNKAATLVLPDRDVAVGELGANDRLVLNMKNGVLDYEIQRV
jgi:hypothetical protein